MEPKSSYPWFTTQTSWFFVKQFYVLGAISYDFVLQQNYFKQHWWMAIEAKI